VRDREFFDRYKRIRWEGEHILVIGICLFMVGLVIYCAVKLWIKREGQDTAGEKVRKNFVALFSLDPGQCDAVNEIGIWEATNQPVWLRKEIGEKDHSTHYTLIENLSFEKVRSFAKNCVNWGSVSAGHFLEIDETNWKELFDAALGEENKDLKLKHRYDYLVQEDIAFHKNRKDLIEKQLSQVDLIVDTVLAGKNSILSDDAVAEIKKETSDFARRYSADPRYIYTFYWSEVRMGATHRKELYKIDRVWTVEQYDYNKTPSTRRTPYPNMNDDNLLESFVKILLDENEYK